MGRIESGDMGRGHRQLHTRAGPDHDRLVPAFLPSGRLTSPQSGAMPPNASDRSSPSSPHAYAGVKLGTEKGPTGENEGLLMARPGPSSARATPVRLMCKTSSFAAETPISRGLR
jgi:hypothetical protein